MNIEKIKKELNTCKLIKEIKYFQEISSTNQYPKENYINSNTLILAESQTHGKGKGNRIWHTSKNTSIAMTIYVKPYCNIQEIENITLKIGTIIKQIIDNFYNVNLSIKLPNDLFLNGKKLCGILVESKVQENKVTDLIIGIGINVNQENIPSELENIATSLKIETHKEVQRELIICEICKQLERNLKC